MKTDIKQECQGRWSGVLTNLGIDERIFNGKHQPCIFAVVMTEPDGIGQKNFITAPNVEANSQLIWQ